MLCWIFSFIHGSLSNLINKFKFGISEHHLPCLGNNREEERENINYSNHEIMIFKKKMRGAVVYWLFLQLYEIIK